MYINLNAHLGKLKGFFGSSGSVLASESLETESNSDPNADSDAANTTDSTPSENNATYTEKDSTTAQEKTSSQKTSDTIKLSVDVKPLSIPAMTSAEIRASRGR